MKGMTVKPLFGAVIFGEAIEIIDGSDFNRYNCVEAIKTFRHKDYCCPFCSHSETIELKIFNEYRGRNQGSYRRAYLECSERCMSYGIFEKSYVKGWTEEEKYSEIIERSLEVFEQMIRFTKDITKFVMV